ncbi:wall-associated receptor kinase 5-like [Tasmannia lanceolata]|uniref:wall-associated receptor kinase 5-like n=1 Tax=Tasmannia lanceolata TaxID=3420 RepID=UPI004063B859
MKTQMLFIILFVLIYLWFCHPVKAIPCQPVKAIPSNCPSKCGNVAITYPFGIGKKECFLAGFEVTCDKGVPFLVNANLTLVEILFPDQVRLLTTQKMAVDCQNLPKDNQNNCIKLEKPFTISGRGTRFVAMGCDTKAYVTNNSSFTIECDCQWMKGEGGVNKHGGLGHCQSSIADGEKEYCYNVTNSYNYAKSSCVIDCGFAVLAEAGYGFNESALMNFSNSVYNSLSLPLVADWAVGGTEKCPICTACRENTVCNVSRRGWGYTCQCMDDYKGNPYLTGSKGCKDRSFPAVPVALAGGFALLATLAASSWKYGSLQQRKLALLKKAIFDQNGGSTLNDIISQGGTGGVDLSGNEVSTLNDIISQGGTGGVDLSGNEVSTLNDIISQGGTVDPTQNPEIFTSETIQKAMDLYKKTKQAVVLYKKTQMIVGRIRQSMSIGTLSDQRQVHIMNIKIEEKSEIESFMRVVRTLSRVTHKNKARLLGCSLDTSKPSLVYEYYSDQTLADILESNAVSESEFSWENRLKIAMETAQVLAFMHSRAIANLHSCAIVHTNLKPSNILLDENYTPKIVQFGVGKLLNTKSYLIEAMRYVDPEYLKTNKLTEKSDVYSFGVILVELFVGFLDPTTLLTNPGVAANNNEKVISLAMDFISMVDENKLEQVVKVSILEEEAKEGQLKEVAALAAKCLKLKGDERPTMAQVVAVLNSIYNEKNEEEEEEKGDEDGDGTEGGPDNNQDDDNGMELTSSWTGVSGILLDQVKQTGIMDQVKEIISSS